MLLHKGLKAWMQKCHVGTPLPPALKPPAAPISLRMEAEVLGREAEWKFQLTVEIRCNTKILINLKDARNEERKEQRTQEINRKQMARWEG